MKKNLLIFGLATVAILVTSCNKNDESTFVEEQPATMTITIAGADGNANFTRGFGTPTSLEENKVVDYTVFVFNGNTNKLQKSVTFTSGLTNTITGLITGFKRVVVIANNKDFSVPVLSVGDDYSKIDEIINGVDLENQTPEVMDTKGLAMSGEATINLVAGANTMSESLKIKRVVAKVKLGGVTVVPDPGHDGTFELVNVHIMKAKGKATLGSLDTFTDDTYLGGVSGDISLMRTYLREGITKADNANRYFYVFPNNNDTGNATLLTIEGVYNGKTLYYPVRINDNTGVAGSTSDNTFIKRNGVYTLNLTIKRPGDGSENPELPVDPATLSLTIEVEDWATELIQNVDL